MTGYLATVASRTLGVAPLLRPVARSRFEPAATTFAGEIDEVVATPAPMSRPTAAPRQKTTPRAAAVDSDSDPDAALVARAVEVHLAAELRPARPTFAPAEAAPAANEEPEATTDPFPRPMVRPATVLHDEEPIEPGAEPLARRDEPVKARTGKGGRLAIDATVASSREVASRNRGESGSEAPTVVVRIGRIDVRAVSTPAAAPAAAPAPRQPPGDRKSVV